jgi:ribonuclease P protein component
MKSFIASLKRRAEFLRVARAGRKCVTASLVAQIAENAHDAEFRVGFTASRKVGNAVERNRARRRLRAAAGIVMPARALPGHDYVLIARRTILSQPFDAVLDDLGTAVSRLAAPLQTRSRPVERKARR